MRAYSLDLRERIVAAVQSGQPQTVTARTYAVSLATVQRYVRLSRHDQLAPRPIPGRPRRIGPEHEDALRVQLEATPDATLAEHVDQWAANHGLRMDPTTMADAIARLGWTRKKRPFTPANKTR
jgi:transposase